jgi:membrane-associated HD superfamily phosphohydrolase
MKGFIQKFYKNNFVYGAKENLSKLSILFIVILNIIVFNIILEGLSFQTQFVNSPIGKYPYYCKNLMQYKDTTNINNLITLIHYYKDDEGSYREKITKKTGDIDFRCEELNKKVTLIKEQIDIKRTEEEISELNNKIYKIQGDLDYFRSNYNTILFEKMAEQNSSKSILEDSINSENIKAKYDEALNEMQKYKIAKEKIFLDFENNLAVKDLEEYIKNNKEQYLKDEEKDFRYYYYMIEIIKMIFLLPLVFSFFYIMKKYLKDEKYILYIIFKNLFFVALIPTLYTIFLIIYKFLPKVFLSKVIEFFYNLDIPFIVYYILVVVFVVIFAIIIIKIQKKFKEDNEKLKNNKISKIQFYNQNLCNSCGNRVSYVSMNFCPICNNRLNIECKNCKSFTINGMNFCQNCGEDLEFL